MALSKLNLAFLILILCNVLSLPAKTLYQDTYSETDGTGISINSIPSGATVYVDRIQRGVTPLVMDTLGPGTYQLVLVKEGYEKRSVRVSLAEGKHLDVTLVLTKAMGHLIINLERASSAPGPEKLPLLPELFVDDVAVSSTYLKLPVGFHRIRVEAFGWEPVERTVMIFEDTTQTLTVVVQPATFRITEFRTERQRLNPYNPGLLGSTDLAFSVSAAGTGSLTIVDSRNNSVFEYQFAPFTKRSQRFAWNGRDTGGVILPDGMYRIILSATSIPYDESPPVRIVEEIPIIIDSSLLIRPWSITSGLSGLLYLPISETLGQGSFQMSTRIAAGFPFGAESAFTSVPFSVGFRFSPLKLWELGLSGEFDASRSPGANQFSLAIRRSLISVSSLVPFSMSLDVSYTLAEISPLVDPSSISWSGSQGGIRLGLPLFVPFGPGIGAGFSPALLWPMDRNGSGSDMLPSLELGAGLARMAETITAGFSTKMIWQGSDHRGDNAADTSVPITVGPWTLGPAFAAVELHWFPRPSVFVFNLAGGLWYYNEQVGGFGSLGFGIIH